MSIASVVTRGYGSFGTVPLIVTAGYSIGEDIKWVTQPPDTTGYATQTVDTTSYSTQTPDNSIWVKQEEDS